MKKFFLICVAALTIGGCCNEPKVPEMVQMDVPEITTPPDSLHLDPFYVKYLNANGIHIASSWRVPDEALKQCYITISSLTSMLPKEVLNAMTEVNTRVTVMGRYEGTTDVPEHAHMVRDTSINWDLRARGLGGSRRFPMSSCAEENLLAYQIDKYHAEDITIHEFAHSIHLIGVIHVHPDINKRLDAALKAAQAQGKWENTYAATDIAEYWAEGVQSWFYVNAEMKEPDGKHNRVNTRKELKKYDPGLYQILSEYFPDTDKRISRHYCADIYHY